MSDSARKWRAFLYTGPLIYFINLFRNAGIVYATNEQLLGPNTFLYAHHRIGKALSLIVLIMLVFLIFEILPEFQEYILGVIDLPRRTKPGMVVDGFVELPERNLKQASTKAQKVKKKKVRKKD